MSATEKYLTDIPKVSQVSKTVWRILGCNPSDLTLQGTNCYLLGDRSPRILIDVGGRNCPEFLTNFKTLVLKLKVRIDHVIITHWHQDHTGALSELIPIFKEINDGDLPQIHKFPRLGAVDDSIDKEYQCNKLENGQIFECPGVMLETIYTPGHTTDHAVVRYREEGVVFCGDCILGEGTAIFEELEDYLTSLERIKSMRPRTIFPGHGPVIEDAVSRVQYYINHQLMREKKVRKFLEEAAPRQFTSKELTMQLYPNIPESLRETAINSIEHHLKKLCAELKIKKENDRYYYFEVCCA